MAKLTKSSKTQIEQVDMKEEKTNSKDFFIIFGDSGTNITQGIIDEEYNADLKGVVGMEVYRKMYMSDAQVFLAITSCELPITATRWYIEAPMDEEGQPIEGSEEIVDFLNQALFEKMDKTWNELLEEILSFFVYGFALFEKVYSYDGNKVWIKELAYRKQTTIEKWETEQGQPGVTQILPTVIDGKSTISIPASKLVLFSLRRKGRNYEGMSLLRPAYKHWYMKEVNYKLDAIRNERQAIGIPVVYMPKTATDKDKSKMTKIVKNIRGTNVTGVAIPGSKNDGWLLEYADNKASQTTEYFKSIEHHDQKISDSVLALFLKLGGTQTGSYAMAESHTDLFMHSLTSYAKLIASVFNRYVIPELVDLNFQNVEKYPQLKFDKIGEVDYTAITDSIQKLTQANVLTTDEDLEKYIREMFNLPPKKEETEEEKQAKIDSNNILQELKTRLDQDKLNQQNQQPPTNQDDIKKQKKDDNISTKEFLESMSLVDNSIVSELYRKCASKEDMQELKKKGIVFNEYEEESPRPLTFAERKVRFKTIKEAMATYQDILSEKLQDISSKQKDDLLNQIKKAVDGNDIGKLGEIKAKYKNELNQVLTDIQKELFEIGKKTASVEMGVSAPTTNNEVKGVMRAQNAAIINKLTSDVENQAITTVTQIANAKGGSITKTESTEAINAVKDVIDNTISKSIATLNTFGITGAINWGRTSVFEQHPDKVYAMQYSAILDDKTTDICLSLDGRVVKAGSPDYYTYSPPRHYNCRSIWVELLEAEFAPKLLPKESEDKGKDIYFKPVRPEIKSIPKSIPATVSIDQQAEMKAPIILKGSPAIDLIKQEIEERKAKLEQYQKDDVYPNRQKEHEDRIKQLEKAIKNKFVEQLMNYYEQYGVKFKK